MMRTLREMHVYFMQTFSGLEYPHIPRRNMPSAQPAHGKSSAAAALCLLLQLALLGKKVGAAGLDLEAVVNLVEL
jgi:hypothetical protein